MLVLNNFSSPLLHNCWSSDVHCAGVPVCQSKFSQGSEISLPGLSVKRNIPVWHLALTYVFVPALWESSQIRKQIQTMLADFYLLKAHTLITVGQTNKFTFFLHCVCAQKHINLRKSPVFVPVWTLWISWSSVSNNRNVDIEKLLFEGLMAVRQTKSSNEKKKKKNGWKKRRKRKQAGSGQIFVRECVLNQICPCHSGVY